MAKKHLMIAAVAVGLFAAILMYLWATQTEQKYTEAIGDTVLVIRAAQNIPAGTPLSDDRVTQSEVPRKYLPPNPIYAKDFNIYKGAPLQVNVKENDIVLTSMFTADEVARDLSSKIPSGERAMSIAVDSVSGISGLLLPGDRVDIIGTFPVGTEDEVIREAKGRESMGYITMNLLQNVTLLAVGNQISGVDGEANRRGGYGTVTLSVTVEEAELLTIAQTRGKLALLLRNREDVAIGAVEKKSLSEVLEQLDVINKRRKNAQKSRKREEDKPNIEIIHGRQ